MSKLKWQTLKEKVEAYGAAVNYAGIKIIRIKVYYNSLTHKTKDRPWLATYNEVTHVRYATKEEAMEAAEVWFAGYIEAFTKAYIEEKEK